VYENGEHAEKKGEIEMINMEKELAKIAREILRIKTFERRYSDDLDFYDRAVWNIKEALEAAYKAGAAAKAS